MIDTRIATGDTEGVDFLRYLGTRYRKRELNYGQVCRRLIKRVGRAQLKAETKQLCRDQRSLTQESDSPTRRASIVLAPSMAVSGDGGG